jgi:hypothetical protein
MGRNLGPSEHTFDGRMGSCLTSGAAPYIVGERDHAARVAISKAPAPAPGLRKSSVALSNYSPSLSVLCCSACHCGAASARAVRRDQPRRAHRGGGAKRLHETHCARSGFVRTTPYGLAQTCEEKKP